MSTDGARRVSSSSLSRAKRADRPQSRRGQGILQATLEQLAVVGFRALSVEVVAARAGVNKTTVYRRWPTKVALVRAAIESLDSPSLTVPDSGTLRGDLLAVGRNFGALASSLEGQSLFRVIAVESLEPQIQELGKSFRAAHERVVATVLERAFERGEIDRLPDHRLVAIMVVGPIHLRMFANNERVDEAFVDRLVEGLLYGLLPRKAR